MKHIVIGTAGHIDHGKTTLIKALTGRDTDTLKEEKQRGISINLGFTYFDLPSGRRAGIVDVPGHEKFIKNMLSGVTGIDIVLMIVAADEGVMPQSREHLQILQLLNVKKGIVVITKKDLVDEEMLALVKEDIVEEFKGTFLQEAPIIAVSSRNGEGQKELAEAIDSAVDKVEEKDKHGIFRLPVDRSFSVSGFGTVVTGTIISGTVSVGDSLQVYPNGNLCRLRGIQIHEKEVENAEAGERCALNLSGVKVEEVQRGCVISSPGILQTSMIIDCKLNYLGGTEKPLINRQRVRVYHGTEELFGRVVLLDKEQLEPGEEGFAQLMLEGPLTSISGDRFVLRSYSPMETIGGGVIINSQAVKKKRFDKSVIQDLKELYEGKSDNVIEKTIEDLRGSFPTVSDLVKVLGKNEASIEQYLMALTKKSVIIELTVAGIKYYVHNKFIEEKQKMAEEILKEFHNRAPLRLGLGKEELKNKLFKGGSKPKLFDELLRIFSEEKVIKISGGMVSLYDFEVIYNEAEQKAVCQVLEEFKKSGLTPPKYEEVIQAQRNKIDPYELLNSLLEGRKLIKLPEDIILHSEEFEAAKDAVKRHIENSGSITVGEARDILQTGRKTAVALLEYLDEVKFTKRLGDKRILY